MLCPKCNQLMEKKRIGDVVIDECLKCRGIWFDIGEIEDVKDEIEPELRWMDFDLWRAQADFKMEFNPAQINRLPQWHTACSAPS